MRQPDSSFPALSFQPSANKPRSINRLARPVFKSINATILPAPQLPAGTATGFTSPQSAPL
jgi:hypothetical protein